ncbi:protein-export membrane protein SecD [Candidatus Kaiserbacteria bacterium RIFCSPHIGHO2_02_FULL_49_34]|uniref:Protein translocase subunit SecD n=1 Tax=Candidatus Kaiserbacteria bacterium RIFCSPHIGHO2_02_FULL_49_34 TaxID=1798491 RepID=A0A1F6DMT3_9BACT|nr:MAG: protein-export membrane protein SecD [Candidatus Kaiserbacteria bacterium RIFCSPHIGHO2_02_FULL_49_34]
MQKEEIQKSGIPFGIRAFHAIVVVLLMGMLSYFTYGAITGTHSYSFKKGLDIAGGTQLIYVADTTHVDPAEVKNLMNVLRDVIEKRINVFGVSEPLIYTETGSAVSDAPAHRLVVELPGVTNIDEAVAQIGATPHLEFKLVNRAPEVLAAQQKYAEGKFDELTPDEVDALVNAYIDTGLTGRYVTNAIVGFSQGGSGFSEPVVNLTFNSEGSKLFADITGAHVGEQLAIFLDGNMLSAPTINEQIAGGTAVVSGNFTLESAKDLANSLAFGSLPIPISLASTQIIDATLGSAVIEEGVVAGLIGFGLITLLLVLWYRAAGVVSIVALAAYVLIMLALVLTIPVTLTAAGIAGLVLSIGIAIDANVLIFERFKEEFRAGAYAHDALATSFSRAWPAIRDGNITTIFAAAVLYWFGTSFVQGFAFMLILGTLVSIISAMLITRAFARLLPNIRQSEKTLISKLLNIGA